MNQPLSDLQCLFTAHKKCYRCGIEWRGPTFKDYSLTAQPLPGCCAACNEIEDRAVQQLSARREVIEPEVLDLHPPQRTAEADDE